jgi:hypothetical protein
MADLEIWRFIRTFAPVTSMWQYILVWVVGREIDSPFLLMRCFSNKYVSQKMGL